MKRLALAATLALLASPAAKAELKAGAVAPDFTAQAYLAGEPFTFRMADALKKGPVVVYFFPSAYTRGCNIEARMFSEAADDFKAQGATLIGVTAGKISELAKFSKDTETCGGKFAVAADPDAQIAKRYDAPLKIVIPAPGNLSARASYVVAPGGRILLAYDNLSPDEHVARTLAAVKDWRAKHPN